MPERDGYIPGVPCWVDTTQPDPDAAAEFYGGLFGWEFEDVMPGDAKYLIGRIRGGDVGAISSPPEGRQPPVAWNSYVWVDSADETAAKVRDAGGTVVMEPMDIFESGRMAVFADPEGAVFSVWQANQHKGSQIVNEHGSVTFNNLNTRDLDGAKAFYGAVFGWETLDLGGSYMWTLPGYGDYLEQLTPGTRDNFATMGAPDGFIDAVAGLLVIADDQPDVPPHWGVTFAVDDADASAARATELGGTVLHGPFDAPWVRMAVITDPQGAMFIASQFVPENKNLGAEVGAA
jgi:predicted enzyme related to lactoylglutathione lyase